MINIYEDGVWYQVLGDAYENNSFEYINKHVKIFVDGTEIETDTELLSIRGVIKENNVQLGAYDIIEPVSYMPVSDGLEIRITRVEKAYEDREAAIPYVTEYRENAEVFVGRETLLQGGEDGVRRQKFELQYHDGVLVSETLVEEESLKDPVTQIIEKGTKIVVIEESYGKASYYTHPRYVGELITAHNTYPMGSMLRVTNLRNGKSVIVKVVDRGIHSPDRVVDLSTTAFGMIESHWRGLVNVRVELLEN